MPHEKIGVQRLHESVAEAIKNAIRRGEYVPGTKLPSERELLEAFAVSRPTLREAFRVLENENLIFSRQGDGRYIQQPLTDNLFRAVTTVCPPEKETILKLIEARETLEVKTASLAAKLITKEELDELHDIVGRIFSLKNSDDHAIPDLFELDLRFHLLVAQASRNPVYLNWLEISIQVLQENRQKILFLPKRREQLGLELQRITNALSSYEPRLAAKYMSAHLRAITKKLKVMPSE